MVSPFFISLWNSKRCILRIILTGSCEKSKNRYFYRVTKNRFFQCIIFRNFDRSLKNRLLRRFENLDKLFSSRELVVGECFVVFRSLNGASNAYAFPAQKTIFEIERAPRGRLSLRYTREEIISILRSRLSAIDRTFIIVGYVNKLASDSRRTAMANAWNTCADFY